MDDINKKIDSFIHHLHDDAASVTIPIQVVDSELMGPLNKYIQSGYYIIVFRALHDPKTALVKISKKNLYNTTENPLFITKDILPIISQMEPKPVV